MKRFFAKLVVPAILALALPTGLAASPLSDVIDDYVVRFDLSELEPDDSEAILAVHAQGDLAHGMKVLLIHEILIRAGALQHTEMHFTEPRSFQLSSAE